MVAIKKTGFENERLQRLGIEPIRFSVLKTKLPSQPERVEFYMLFIVTGGVGKHAVDFVEYPLCEGDLIFIRPGQVQEWYDYADLEGEVILVEPTSLANETLLSFDNRPELSLLHWPSMVSIDQEAREDLLQSLQRMRRDFTHFDSSPMDIALIRHELQGLLLRIARGLSKNKMDSSFSNRGLRTFYLFKTLLEEEYKRHHQLKFYAKRLGYAESTLSRSSLRAEGCSAKVMIDRRVSLEAKRMLVHSDASVVEIGFYLGFSEATNFIKFFRRLEGCTPQYFREQKIIK